MENPHEMIQGYRDLSRDEIDTMNEIKKAKLDLDELWNSVMNDKEQHFTPDDHWMNIAKTHFEEGFSAFVKAVVKPELRF